MGSRYFTTRSPKRRRLRVNSSRGHRTGPAARGRWALRAAAQSVSRDGLGGAEAQVAVALAREGPAPERRAREPGGAEEAPAAEDADLGDRTRYSRIGRWPDD